MCNDWRTWTELLESEAGRGAKRTQQGVDNVKWNGLNVIRDAVVRFVLLFWNHEFNKMQLDWLDRIEKSLLEETVMDKQILNSGAFRTNGGFNAIDKRFGGKLQELIDELNEYLYNDEENVAWTIKKLSQNYGNYVMY